MSALRVIDLPQDRPVLALELPEQTSFDEWVAIGRRLCLGQQALNWHIGDWWAFGDHRYGERAKVAAEGLFGREFQTLANLATVSRTFEASRRREVLTFTHHAEVVSLSADSADQLLSRAEREHWSTRELRKAVHTLKAANDPQPGEEAEQEVVSKPLSSQSLQAQLTTAYETVIEFADALGQLRTLTRREADLLTVAETYLGEAHAGHRQCPDDFDIIFVEQGRLACESWYTASRITVNRWLIERGKRRLIELRAAFVRHQREELHPVENAVVPHVEQPIDETLHALAREAASFLRISRYGGWRITSTDDGNWLVGTVRRTSDELIAMAERQGFDSIGHRAALQADGEEGVKS